MNRLQKISRELLRARMKRAATLNVLRRAKPAALKQISRDDPTSR